MICNLLSFSATNETIQSFAQPITFFLLFFMYEHREERIILRQLKAAFATEAKLEQFLSEMIDCQLIIRENRQYRLNFPIYTRQLKLRV